jgi:DNA repair protein RadC
MTNTTLYELRKIQSDFPKVQVTSSEKSANFIKQFYQGDIEIYESFFILLVNSQCNTIGFAKISQGGVTGTVVDIRIIAKYAVDSLATGIILAHNHPSGNLKPSPEDISVTNKIKQAMLLFDVKVLDHLILTQDSFYSFSDAGIL